MGEWRGMRVWWLGCIALLAACRVDVASDGRGGADEDAGTRADDAGVSVQVGTGPFVDQNGFHYPSKADCLANNDGELVVLDGDGDGHTAWWLERCNDTTPQYGLRLAGADDCDDMNASVYRNAWPDADGDGVTGEGAQCVADVPAGYLAAQSPLSDCDDNDATVSRTLYTDADGDGFGSLAAPICASAPDATARPGFAANSSDCDDNDASVHPSAVELWNDGTDSDCDAAENPLTCVGTNTSCGCELLTPDTVGIDPVCGGPDLFVVKQVSCVGCGGRTVLTLGNRGPKPASLVAFSVDGAAFPTLGMLEPGGVTLPIVMPYAARELEITALPDECNLDDNVQALQSSAGICDP